MSKPSDPNEPSHADDPDSTSWATRTLHSQGQLATRRMRGYALLISTDDGLRKGERIEVTTPRLRIGSRSGNDLCLNDPAISRHHAELLADERGYRVRDLGSSNGTFVDGYRVQDVYLKASSVLRLGATTLAFQLQSSEHEIPAVSAERFGAAVGRSLAMRELFAVLTRAASCDLTLLLQGESGTGKELLAHGVHEASARRTGPFVVFDCGAVPSSLVESELFGHERGAFTGATERRIGAMEQAIGGTLFIDELGELPLALQPKLLRAIEQRQIKRVGGSEVIDCDVRFVAATNRDLLLEQNRGAFREDLYYRIAVIDAEVPPLRERREDIPLLVTELVRKSLSREPARAQALLDNIKPESWARLSSHAWPGNVRELRNVVERSLALGEEQLSPRPASPSYSPPRTQSGAPTSTVAPEIDLERPYTEQKGEWTARFDEAYLQGQLDKHGGNIARAARAAGLERMHFKRVLKKYRE